MGKHRRWCPSAPHLSPDSEGDGVGSHNLYSLSFAPNHTSTGARWRQGMTSETYLRRVAASLLRLALKVTPQDSFAWGQAVLAELNYVEGDWPALAWALGGGVVLTKQAMLSLILPGRRRTAISSKPKLFAKEGPMRKATLAAIGACAVASLLFFLAPVFRQAFQASLAQWHGLADFAPYEDRRPSPELEA